MFNPIKNLITYIQKNASGSTFFGGNSSNAELSDENIMETNSSTIPPQLLEMAAMNEKNHDQNENEIFEDCTAVSTAIDDPLMIKEDEAAKDIFLDFPPSNDQDEHHLEFPASEVVVLDNPDLNASITSEPGSDPLAIDPFGSNVPDSPSALDTSTENNVLFMVDIDEIGSKPLQMNEETELNETGVLTAVKAVDEQEIRSDGSDSGLGSETSALQTTATSVADSSVCSTASCSPRVVEKVPMRSNLKRRFEQVDGSLQLQKKLRRTINFEGVKVFYFPRIQGHGCVPSQGGCTLGMGAHHISFKTFTLSEHAAELRRAHKLQLQEVNPRGSSSDESDSDEELSEGSGSDLDAETNGFLQPVSPKQRRALLKAAGVRKIDPSEKIECRNIRNSREVCGCMCRDFCDPDTCTCSQAGIKCQVDRAMFPCGCSHDACGNAIGRIEFSPGRVRTHFFHTMMRMEMENRQQKRPDGLVSQLAPTANHSVYGSVSPMANNTAVINSFSTIPNYGLEQSQTAIFHHHMHQQHNAYINHIPQTHPANSVYANLPNPMGMETTAAPLPLPLPQPHSHYLNTTVAEPESIGNSIAISGGSLHYPDGSIYPPVPPATIPPPPAAAYGDILAPYAASISYHSPQVESSYAAGVFTSYHNPHHVRNHQQHQQSSPQQFLGYASSCSGELNDYNESQSSFISLNAPEACSSRLSAINDLLHNNRNTTAALVAVSRVSTEDILIGGSLQEVIAYPSDRNDESEEDGETEGSQLIEECQKIEKNQLETENSNQPETKEPPLVTAQSEHVPLPEPIATSNDVSSTSPKETNLSTPIILPTDSIVEDDRPASVAAENGKETITDILPPIVETVSA